MNKEITLKDAENFTPDLWELFGSVPLGNTDFQIREFVMKHLKDGRNYRQLILDIKKDAINIKKERIERKKEEAEARIKLIKIEELKDEKSRWATGKRRKDIIDNEIIILEAEIEDLEIELKNRDILVNDGMIRLRAYLECLKEVGFYDREKFEGEEKEYWSRRLLRDAHLEVLQQGTIAKGTLDSLDRLGITPDAVLLQTQDAAQKNKAMMLEQKTKQSAVAEEQV